MKNILFLFLLIPLLLSAQKESLLSRHHIQHQEKSYYFFVTSKSTSFDNEKFYHWYRAQRIRETQGGASGELLHGKFEVYFNNKQLSEKGNFHRGLRDGGWKHWNTNGILESTAHWTKGRLKRKIEYNKEGKKSTDTKYGLLRNVLKTDSTTIKYSKDSTRVKHIAFNSAGKKTSITKTKDGNLHGKQKSKEKDEFKIEVYKNGVLTSKQKKEPKKSTSNKPNKRNKEKRKKEIKREEEN